MIIAIAAPDSSEVSSIAALEIAREWQRQERNVQLVAPEPPRESAGIDCASISTAGVTNLRLGDELQRAAESHDRTIVECPADAVKLQRATLSVADAALLLCGPGGDGFWPSGRTVEMARNAGEIRSKLHVGYVVTESALRSTSAEATNANPDRVDLPIFDTTLDLAAASAGSTDAEGRIRRAPSAPAPGGIEMLVDELEEISRPSSTQTTPETRTGGLRVAN